MVIKFSDQLLILPIILTELNHFSHMLYLKNSNFTFNLLKID